MNSVLVVVLLSGLTTGAMYALAAEGLNLIWGVMKVVNLAHGELLMLGAFTTYFLWSVAGISPLVSVIPTAVVLYAIGSLLERTMIRRVIGSPELISLLLTFGISILITNVSVVAFGAEFRSVPFLQEPVAIGSSALPLNRLVMAGVAVILSLITYGLLQGTKMGTAIRAVSIDRDMAEQCGIDTRRVYNVTFALGALLAAIAGALITPLVPFNPLIGQTYILKAFAVVVLGGMGNFLGALYAGLLIGVVEAAVAYTFSVQISEAVAFLVIIATLLVRPSGLMGARA